MWNHDCRGFSFGRCEWIESCPTKAARCLTLSDVGLSWPRLGFAAATCDAGLALRPVADGGVGVEQGDPIVHVINGDEENVWSVLARSLFCCRREHRGGGDEEEQEDVELPGPVSINHGESDHWLGEDARDDAAVDIGEAFLASLVEIGEQFVIDA